jgi:hypothetical protein
MARVRQIVRWNVDATTRDRVHMRKPDRISPNQVLIL